MCAKSLTSIALAALLVGCSGLHDTPLVVGVSSRDVSELDRVVRKQKHAQKIYEYHYEDGGWILIQTDVGAFSARRVHGRWELTPIVVLG